MPTVTILDDYQRVALSSADWSAVRASHDIAVIDHHLSTEDDVAQALAGSEVVVAMRERTPLQASLIGRLPNLRLIVTTGMRNAAIDVDAAHEHGITVCGTQARTNSVPELTIGMMIALMRGFVAEDAAMRAGGWQHTIGPGLAGNTLGVIGLGRLGRPVATLAQAFGMEVIAWSPNLTQERADGEAGALRGNAVTAVSKERLLSEADVITIHMPLSERSRGLLGAGDLALMKHTAYLVNTPGGPIVDEGALVDALSERRIAGAALDVYDIEPLPVDHPLRSLPNTLLLPHIGYVTTETYREWFAQVVEDIVA